MDVSCAMRDILCSRHGNVEVISYDQKIKISPQLSFALNWSQVQKRSRIRRLQRGESRRGCSSFEPPPLSANSHFCQRRSGETNFFQFRPFPHLIPRFNLNRRSGSTASRLALSIIPRKRGGVTNDLSKTMSQISKILKIAPVSTVPCDLFHFRFNCSAIFFVMLFLWRNSNF